MGTLLPLVDSSSQNLHSPAGDGASWSGPITRALPDVLRLFGDESVFEYWRVPQHSPEGIRCPNGNSGRIAERLSRHPVPRASQPPLKVWGQAFHLCSAVSTPDLDDIGEVLPVAPKTSWTLACRIDDARALAQGDFPLSETAAADMRACNSFLQRGLQHFHSPTPQQLPRASFRLPQEHTWAFAGLGGLRDVRFRIQTYEIKEGKGAANAEKLFPDKRAATEGSAAV